MSIRHLFVYHKAPTVTDEIETTVAQPQIRSIFYKESPNSDVHNSLGRKMLNLDPAVALSCATLCLADVQMLMVWNCVSAVASCCLQFFAVADLHTDSCCVRVMSLMNISGLLVGLKFCHVLAECHLLLDPSPGVRWPAANGLL
ncbi:hypothetical protein Nepgr_014647 [Nepenthes gracilis]|uniref:Uncharacterized protein n=1 Tax=Nepenthes gracilis TaxID=150966 RepID=A0AAD3SM77_NEPGR|nr:hypothetical protein Nepgr_014647 [Nepenthes gracilis]